MKKGLSETEMRELYTELEKWARETYGKNGWVYEFFEDFDCFVAEIGADETIVEGMSKDEICETIRAQLQKNMAMATSTFRKFFAMKKERN